MASSSGRPEDLLRDLRKETGRLRLAEREGTSLSLHAALTFTYGQLSPAAASVFRALALLPERRFTAADIDPDGRFPPGMVETAVHELRLHALVAPIDGALQLHPAVRSFARERLAEEGDSRAVTPPQVALHTDFASLPFASGSIGRDARDQIGLQEHALRSAQSAGDVTGEIQALVRIGELRYRAGRSDDAADALRVALSVAERAGERAAAAEIRLACGQVEQHRQVLADAEQSYRSSAAAFADIGDRDGEARALRGLGDVLLDQENHAAAESAFRRAVELFRAAGRAEAEPALIGRLGRLAEVRSDHPRARELYSAALEQFEAVGDVAGAADIHLRLGLLATAAGDLEGANQALNAAERLHLRVNALPEAARADLALCALAVRRCDYATAGDAAQRALEFALKAGAQRLVAVATYAQGIRGPPRPGK